MHNITGSSNLIINISNCLVSINVFIKLLLLIFKTVIDIFDLICCLINITLLFITLQCFILIYICMLSLSKQLLSSIRKPFATNKRANDPNWKRLDKLKKVPFFDESLKFPLHIPIKHRYVYSPTKRFHIP
jgi:hypothetical protein